MLNNNLRIRLFGPDGEVPRGQTYVNDSPIAEIGAALNYDAPESMLASGVPLSDVYATVARLRTVPEDIGGHDSSDDAEALPETKRCPTSAPFTGPTINVTIDV